jgi:hypothetical protein
VVFPPFGAYMWPNAKVTLTACATSGLQVSYAASSTGNICTVTGTELSMTRPGLCTVTASQAGDATFAPAAPVTGTFQVDQQVVTAQWASPPTSITVGSSAIFTLKVSSPSGPITEGGLSLFTGYGNACTGNANYTLSNGNNVFSFKVTGAAVGECSVQGTINGDFDIADGKVPIITVTIN